MRVFVALELPQRTKDNLERSATQLKTFANKGAFVPKENYHITLHFLGEVTVNNLIYIQSAMDSVKNMVAPTIAVSQFAILRGGDVVCAKVRQNGALTEVHDALGAELEKHGFFVEHRAYRPHITMIRKYGFDLPFSEVTKSVDVFNKPFEAGEIVLYQSVLEKSGAKYHELYRVSLKSAEQQ